MSSTNKVFVSPGVYTSEKDISYVTSKIGVTTLGLVGETTKGPAFQPIFVSNYNQFTTFFGGLDSTIVKETGTVKYELPYIAKSYFTNSNQAYITRVLGLSGYDAGDSWGIATVGSGAYSDNVVAVLRSRATYSGQTLVPNVAAVGDVTITTTGAVTDPLAEFDIEVVTVNNGTLTYTVSLDSTSRSFITRVLGTDPLNGKAPLFVEEIYLNAINDREESGDYTGLAQALVTSDEYNDYKTEFKSPVSPYVVSELNGSVVKKLFNFVSISDGNAANKEIKISIANIKPDTKEFDIQVRAFYDTDASPVFLEKFAKCNMDPTSANFIGRRIGTLDGYYSSNSNYILVELSEEEDTSDSFPAGFTGVTVKSGTTAPKMMYNTEYGQYDKLRKIYLGVSDTVGIDQDYFDFKGVGASGITDGYHMDSGATGTILDGYTFQVGDAEFRDADGIEGTSYEKIYARKFTMAPFGGFDGWDIYRTRRTNIDTYKLGQTGSTDGLTSTAFDERVLSNGENGSNSDYYAFYEGIYTFDNPEATNINVFATPGIDLFDNISLVDETVEMVENDRADCIYITTLPDTDGGGQIITAEDAVDTLDNSGIDSSYTATYWPWVQVNDSENSTLIYLPPTRDVVRNIALTDNVAFPWFAVAGIERGNVDCVKARKKLTLPERDTLYEGRINPLATFASEGVKIWGNKTLQVKDSALSSLNVRRLLLQTRKLISAVSIRLLFEQNDEIVRNQFKSLVNPILENIRSERGIYDFRVVVDNSPESIDRNELNGIIYLKPTKALEVIKVEFVVMNTGASFEDV